LYVLLQFAGCSSGPSESEARKFLEEKIRKQSNGLIRLLDFQKRKGRDISGAGQALYLVDYEAEVEFLTDCYWAGSSSSFEVFPEAGGPYMPSFLEGKKRMVRGQREKLTGTLRFEYTGQGWQEEGVKRFSLLPSEYRDMAINDLNNVAAAAREYRQRPVDRGGGGGSYIGFAVPQGIGTGVKIVSLQPDEIILEKEGVRGRVDHEGSLHID